MSEVPNRMGLLESRMNEITTKAGMIDEMTSRLEVMPIRELMTRVEALEKKATIVGGFECRDSSMGCVARMEERVKGLDNANKRSSRWSQICLKI